MYFDVILLAKMSNVGDYALLYATIGQEQPSGKEWWPVRAWFVMPTMGIGEVEELAKYIWEQMTRLQLTPEWKVFLSNADTAMDKFEVDLTIQRIAQMLMESRRRNGENCADEEFEGLEYLMIIRRKRVQDSIIVYEQDVAL